MLLRRAIGRFAYETGRHLCRPSRDPIAANTWPLESRLAVLAEVHATFGRPEVRRAPMVRREHREPVLAGIVKFTERVLPIFRREQEGRLRERNPSALAVRKLLQ